DVPDLLLADAVAGRDVLPRLDYVHVVVLGTKHFRRQKGPRGHFRRAASPYLPAAHEPKPVHLENHLQRNGFGQRRQGRGVLTRPEAFRSSVRIAREPTTKQPKTAWT